LVSKQEALLFGTILVSLKLEQEHAGNFKDKLDRVSDKHCHDARSGRESYINGELVVLLSAQSYFTSNRSAFTLIVRVKADNLVTL
jgi:hypothetical protein